MEKNVFIIFILFLIMSAYNTCFSQCGENIQYVTSGQVTLISTWTETYIEHDCGALATNDYLVDVYKVDWYNPVVGTVTVRNDLTNGNNWYLDPQWGGITQCGWGTFNPTTGHFTTYVYYVHETWDGYHIDRWIPCQPSQANVAYYACRSVGAPTIGTGGMPYTFTESQTGIKHYTLFNNWGTNLTAYSQYANCWSWYLRKCIYTNPTFFPPWSDGGISIGQNGGQNLSISNSNFHVPSCNYDLPTFGLYCFVKTEFNSSHCPASQSSQIAIDPVAYGPPQGCPWIFTVTGTGIAAENNSLYKSEFFENYGSDMKDLYVIDNAPVNDANNVMTFDLAEPSSDYTLLDQAQMFAIDHPAGTVLGITQNGDIVTYDTSMVTSTDMATLNNTANITQYFHYNYEGSKMVKGPGPDSIYAHFDTSSQNKAVKKLKGEIGKYGTRYVDSLAIVGNVGRDPALDIPIGNVNKNWAGAMNIYTNDGIVSRKFARRENIHKEIIPVGSINQKIDHINVNFAENYEIGYFSVVPVHYYGYTQTALQMLSAIHSTLGDVSDHLSSKDSVYTYIDSTCTVTLQFQDNSTPQAGYVRNYVMQLNGHYTVQGTDQTIDRNRRNILGENKGQNLKPFEFNLLNNYPNPFNPVTSIKYSIPKDGEVTLKVYNMVGQLVETLVNGSQIAGEYEVNFNGENHASGVYIYRLEYKQAGSKEVQNVISKKMILIK